MSLTPEPIVFRFHQGTDMRGFDLAALQDSSAGVTFHAAQSISFAGASYDSRLAFDTPAGTLSLLGNGLGWDGVGLTGGVVGAVVWNAPAGTLGSLGSISGFGYQASLFQALFDDPSSTAGAAFLNDLLAWPNRIYGSAEADLLRGGSFGDTLRGGAGDDTLWGQAGNDRLFGQDQSDRLLGGAGRDSLYGGAGTDTLSGGDAGDRLFGGSQNDRLVGAAGYDVLRGGTGHDTLLGGRGNDTIYGAAGADQIIGGTGNDRLVGGDGADIFVFRNHAGSDTITDFQSGVDKVRIEASSAISVQVPIEYEYLGGNVTVTFLDVTITLLGIEENGLNFDAGGDFELLLV